MDTIQEISEHTKALIRKLRLIDDSLFPLVMDKECCEELLSVLMDDPKIKVLEFLKQEKMYGLQRQAILDAVCQIADGTIVNIEVQKGDHHHDFKRTRTYCSLLLTNFMKKGYTFELAPNIIVFYITDYDATGLDEPIVSSRRYLEVNDKVIRPVEDGEKIYYVNVSNRKDKRYNPLFDLFLTQDVANSKEFPHIANRINYFKDENQGGYSVMCDAMNELRMNERHVQKIISACDMLNMNKISMEDAMEYLQCTHEQMDEYYDCYKKNGDIDIL